MPADPNIIKGRGESVLLACWSGRDYAEVSSLQRAMVHEAISQLEFSEDERVLDVGCGDGLLTRAAARMLPLGYAVGVDASPRMIATAHAATAPTESGPWFVVADARRLPFGPAFRCRGVFQRVALGSRTAAGTSLAAEVARLSQHS